MNPIHPPVIFKSMSRKATFESIIARYLKRHGFVEGSMRFLFENDIVKNHMTPDYLEMELDEENFVINVHVEQISG